MRYILFLLSVTALASIGGCIRTPQPETYPFSTQQKMQAAHHWDVLANDVADQINNELIRRGYLETPVYVNHSCGKADDCGPDAAFPFDEAFNDLLTTQLVNFGVPTLAGNDDSGLVVNYKVQVVFHRSPPRQWPRPGVLTSLTAGIIVMRNAPDEILALAAAAATDTLRATSVVNGHYEVIISTSIVDNNVYLMRKSDIYYINDTDFWQYRKSEPAAEIELTGSRY